MQNFALFLMASICRRNLTTLYKAPEQEREDLRVSVTRCSEESKTDVKSSLISSGILCFRKIAKPSPLKLLDFVTVCDRQRGKELKPITPPAPTYCDIIKEAKRQFARNQKEFRIEKHRINEEIKLLRQRQERIDKELDRLQAKATKKPYEVKNDFEKFLHKLRSEARTKKEFLASPSSSSLTEDYNYEKEECQEKPEGNCV
ncbi:hypothetical protein PANDA_005919 [Ailuropoda melanoleuca]|uniref:Uncharacterized protein n=1 Tax=Ailuropoda melanoleuca TaxID=9646 RepID=D2H731_AILME|nr:hypothetical protein PANDA_005919 [Ailuropoda melanoleuca]